MDVDESTDSGRRPITAANVLLAFAISIAPFVVQTTALALSRSFVVTVAVAIAFVLAMIALAIAGMARMAGSLRAVGGGSVVGVVLAIVGYHLLALPVAWLICAHAFPAGVSVR